jgi:hypothetical protein
VRDQVDPAIVPDVRRQRRPASAPCARLQSPQLPAHPGNAGANQGLVADQPQGETDPRSARKSPATAVRCLPDAEVAIPRKLFEEILRMIAELRPQPIPRRRERRGCHESNEKPRERCVLASPKSTPLRLAAERFGSWRTTLTSPPAKSAETAEKSGFDTGSSGECRVEPVHSILRITRLRMRT